MTSVKTNLHTHTYRCKHADGDVDDYCREAVAADLHTLGMSDHTALPDDRWLGVRMAYKDLPSYMQTITDAQKKYPQLTILRAAECEYDEAYASYYRDELLGEYNCDYLIGAVHYFPHKGEWLSPFFDMNAPDLMHSFADYFIKSMQSGLFAFMAHPDNFASSRMHFDEEAKTCVRAMCEAAADLNVYWEVNGYGFRKQNVQTPYGERNQYPLEEFWDIASEYPIRVVVNSDAHRPQDVAANLDDALDLANRKKLKVVDVDEVLAVYG